MACNEWSQGTASRAPGCAGADSGAVPPVSDRQSQALRAGERNRPRPALSRPRPGRRSGVNRCAIEHNRAFCNLAPVARRLAWWVKRFAPCGFAEGTVMSCAPAQRPAPPLRRVAKSQSARSRLRRQRECLARRCAQGGVEPPPAHGSHSRGSSPAGLRSRARCAPSPSAPKGAPRSSTATPQSSCAARHGAALQRRLKRREPPRRQGQALRALRGLDGIGVGAGLHPLAAGG